jgi:tetratricopeptide (TPR) repeat protein
VPKIRQNRAIKALLQIKTKRRNQKMRERIANNKIPMTVKGQLPIITADYVKERACTFCPYYAGCYQKRPRCMLKVCGWDEEEARFHPALRQILPDFEKKAEKAKAKYEDAQRDFELLLDMFKDELKQEEIEADECYECCYRKCGPCLGVCYKRLTET